jgi:hypothetical protein
MSTPITSFRLTADDRRRIARIKHCEGYATDVRVIRQLLEDREKQLDCTKALEHYDKHLSSSIKKESEIG